MKKRPKTCPVAGVKRRKSDGSPELRRAVVGGLGPVSRDFQTVSSFNSSLLKWYKEHARDLPWRGADAYGVWVSEIMCQQTRVETVIPYYLRWMQAFPDVQALAKASLDDVNKVWAGMSV